MKDISFKNHSFFDWLVTGLVWFCVLLNTYGLLVQAPYIGFYFNPSNGKVTDVFMPQSGDLRENDILKRIGPVAWDAFRSNKLQSLFYGAQKGQIYEIDVLREGQPVTVQWKYPGFNSEEFSGRFFSTWWLSFVFLLFGYFTQQFIRPRDLSWGLLLAVNYFLAIFIAAGNLSSSHILGSAIQMRVAAWLLVPVFLQLHWIIPIPLARIPRWSTGLLYAVPIALATTEALQLPPNIPYGLGLILAFVGSLVVLLLHGIFQPKYRSDVYLIGSSMGLAFLPIAITIIITLFGNLPESGPLSFFALPVMPAAYFYAINRRRMGNMEMRASRVVSALAYTALLSATLPFVVLLAANLTPQGSQAPFFVMFTLATIIFTILVFPFFQSYLEQHLLGITLPHKKILETYSTQITASATLNDLLSLLKNEIFNSLQVQQYAFLTKTDEADNILLSKGVEPDSLQVDNILELLGTDHPYRLSPPSREVSPLSWVRLIIPLEVDANTIGIWLLGKRDPDDLYPQADLPIIQALANQTAIVLDNLLQAQRLKSMHQANVDRYETERHNLGRELHDVVLNDLAALLMTLDDNAKTPSVLKQYDSLAQHLREIVSELRPPLLSYGLKLGLEELADNLMERNQEVSIHIRVEGQDTRYGSNMESHIYRMAQEACENAMRHGHASRIEILGNLQPDDLELMVVDNGNGFDTHSMLHMDYLLEHKHFGLAGMVERALLIGAKLKVNSARGTGTQVTIQWKPQK
ncbi:MAG: hypothetical protein HYZ25_05815 [Chloroflexi bacterium]|nr:hypothetical protein [Chloroflexota bacterium]